MAGEAAWGGFVVILILAFSIAGAGAILEYAKGQHECNENKDCQSNNYCGSDFSCHEFPQQPVVLNNWIVPSLIVGACIILGAVIVRGKKPRVQ